MKFTLPEIPHGSFLGINNSGMHDSAIAIVDRQGQIIFASSLERLSRVKQDGRPPTPLLQGLDWSKIAGIGISTSEFLQGEPSKESITHPNPLLHHSAVSHPKHDQPFYDFFSKLKTPKHYFSHTMSHLASAYFISGLPEAMSLVYDAGTYNEYSFGGLYHGKGGDITLLDCFNANNSAKVTLLYALVTALAGFSPSKHEGKITGLAAFGKPTKRCRQWMEELMADRNGAVGACFQWTHRYSHDTAPIFIISGLEAQQFRKEAEIFTKEELAATVQAMAEEHVLEILKRAKKHGLIKSDSICLSGGLFANVKINQRIKEWGFKNVFVAPPMTDDGTALGAALLLAQKEGSLKKPYRVPHMFHGLRSTQQEVLQALKDYQVVYHTPKDAPEEIAQAINKGLSVALYQGACEFGPRALGHRSVLASAENPNINQILNKKFHRTEFMPFAPMTLWEDAPECYENIAGAEHTAEFMTMTFNCTEKMKKLCPAVVHVDGTARPQLVRKEVNPLIYDIIARYKKLSGRPAIINTSYNMHEEPIIGNPGDAIGGFFESGVDLLYVEGYLVRKEDNYKQATEYLQGQVTAPTQKEQRATALWKMFEERALHAWMINVPQAKEATKEPHRPQQIPHEKAKEKSPLKKLEEKTKRFLQKISGR